ncbi:MAG: hypothetical protein ACO4B4_11075 [Planctomycetota bacterium]
MGSSFSGGSGVGSSLGRTVAARRRPEGEGCDPRRRPPIRLLAPILVALVGCSSLGRVGPPPQQALLTEPDAPLEITAAVSPDFRARYVTSLDALPVRVARGEDALWHSRPRTTDWAMVPLDERGRSRVTLGEEGVHLIGAAPLGAAPLAATVEVIVDRTEPLVKIRFERMRRSSVGDTHVKIHWRADDAHLQPRACSLEVRAADSAWQPLSLDLVASGGITFPWSEAQVRASFLRFAAIDLAGNRTTIEIPLAEAFDRPKWTAGGGTESLVSGESAPRTRPPAGGGSDPSPEAREERDERAGAPAPRPGGTPAAPSTVATAASDPPAQAPRGPSAGTASRRPVERPEVARPPEVSTPPTPPAPTDPEPAIVRGVGSPAGERVEAAPRGGAPIPWPVSEGEILRGGSELPAPIRGVVELIDASGTVLLLEREGNRLRLPSVDVAGAALRARGERSPSFSIDASAPAFERLGIEAGEDGVRVTWSLAEPEEPGGVEVIAALEGVGAPGVPLPLLTSPSFLPLPRGEYRLTIRARDARGFERVDGPRTLTVGEQPPGIRDLAGRVLPGGMSRYLLIERGSVRGAVQLKIRAESGGAPIETRLIEADARLVLWDVPPVDGRFVAELEWTDPQGNPRRRVLEPAFAIDSSPRRPIARLAAPVARDRFAVLIEEEVEGEQPLEVAALLHRRGEEGEWSEADSPWTERSLEGGDRELVIDATSWGEGRWHLGLLLRDRYGRLFAEPIEAGAVRIDRTPPVLGAGLAPTTSGVEGVPLGAVFQSSEPLAAARVLHLVEGESREIEVELREEPSGVGSVRVDRLAPGGGILRLEGLDAAGNRAACEIPIEVEPALSGPIVLYPAGTAVPPGDEIFIEVPISPRFSRVEELELRLHEQGSDRVVGRSSLSRSDRVSFRAPERAGEYRIEVGPTGERPLSGGVVPLRVDPEADPGLRERTLVAEVRTWEEQRRASGATPSLEAARGALVQTLQRALAEDPRREQLRRALARLHFLGAPPRIDLAAEVLQGGLAIGLSDRARAALLNDLAVISIEVDPERARRSLERALELEPTALRHRNLADILARSGADAEATRSYLRAAALDPADAVARERWARSLSRVGARGGAGSEERVESDARRQIEEWYHGGAVDEAEAQRLYRIATGGGSEAP